MKKILSLFLCVVLVAGAFCGCSRTSNELTEENVKATVETVCKALQEFDTDTLKKYVDSSTLSVIVDYADNHEQFAELGRAIFENLSMSMESFDTDTSIAVVSMQNKDLYNVANSFASELKNDYTTIQLLTKLDDEDFLDMKLAALCQDINDAEMQPSSSMINIKVTQGKKNLILKFDEIAENNVSGGALDAIKMIYR